MCPPVTWRRLPWIRPSHNNIFKRLSADLRRFRLPLGLVVRSLRLKSETKAPQNTDFSFSLSFFPWIPVLLPFLRTTVKKLNSPCGVERVFFFRPIRLCAFVFVIFVALCGKVVVVVVGQVLHQRAINVSASDLAPTAVDPAGP